MNKFIELEASAGQAGDKSLDVETLPAVFFDYFQLEVNSGAQRGS